MPRSEVRTPPVSEPQVQFVRVVSSQKLCADSLLVCQTPVCTRTHKNNHVKDPVILVRVRWIMERRKDPAILGLGNATLLQLAFLGESDQNFPLKKFPLGQHSVK